MTKKIEKRLFFYNVPKDSPIARWCESQDSFTKSLNWLIKSVIHLTGNDHIDIFDYISQQDNLVDFLGRSSNNLSNKVKNKSTLPGNMTNVTVTHNDSDSGEKDSLNAKDNKSQGESSRINGVNANNFKEIPDLFNGADDFN